MKFLVGFRYIGNNLTKLLYDDEEKVIVFETCLDWHLPYCITNNKSSVELNPLVTRTTETIKVDPVTHERTSYWRIETNKPNDIYDKWKKTGIRDRLEKSWEDRVVYDQCWMFDHKELCMCCPEGSNIPIFEFTDLTLEHHNLRKFFKSYLKTILTLPLFNPKRVAIDIEVYSPEGSVSDPQLAMNPISAVSFYSNDGLSLVLGLKSCINTIDALIKEPPKIETKDFQVVILDSEVGLILKTFEIINQYPFVVTFAGDNYDFPTLFHRAKNLGIKDENIPIYLEKDDHETKAFLKRGIHIDVMTLFNYGLMTYAFPKISRNPSLEEISQNILGRGKLPPPKFDSPEFNEELARYCWTDSKLTLENTEAFDNVIISIILLACRIYDVGIEELTRTYLLRLNESLFVRIHRSADFLTPNQEFFDMKNKIEVTKGKDSAYKGAVIQSKPGVYFPTKVLDFGSLYPGIYDTRNISPETISCEHEECRNNIVPENNFHICQKIEGIISAFFGASRDSRLEYKKQKTATSKAIAGALKIILLSFYGLFGSPKTGYMCVPVAAACTSYSRYSIQTAIKKADELQIPVVYVHTDSMFLNTSDLRLCQKLIQDIHQSTKVEMELDKEYRFTVISTNANLLGVLPDGKPDIVGLMGKKSNVCTLHKQTFKEITTTLGTVQTREDIEKIREDISNKVKLVVEKIKKRDFVLEELELNTILSKNPEEGSGQDYDVAMQYVNAGVPKKAGDRIRKILTVGRHTAKPIELTRLSEVDTEKYIARLNGILGQILLPLDISFNNLENSRFANIQDAFNASPKRELDLEFIEDEGMNKWLG